MYSQRPPMTRVASHRFRNSAGTNKKLRSVASTAGGAKRGTWSQAL